MQTRIVLGGICVALILALSGCATQPIGPQTRSAWMALHSHEYVGVSTKDALKAAHQVLTLADHDFKYDFPPHQLIATRTWSIYMVITATMGTDYWKISATPNEQGSRVTVQISRAAGAVMPTFSPVVGGAGGVGVGAESTSMPGQPIQGPFPYDLFWHRMDYMLGKTSHWLTCKEAKVGKTRRQKINDDVLCSVTTDDELPKKLNVAPGNNK